MLYLISYDIVEDRRRTRLAHLLEDYGKRVQYSVFECQLSDAELLKLRKKMIREIDQTVDSIRIYLLCARCAHALEIVGSGLYSRADKVLLV